MRSPVEKNSEYIVEIVDQGFEGEGIAKIDGFTIFIEGAIKDINEYLPENTSPNFGDGQIIYNYKELHICKVQEDGTPVMFTIQTK